MTYLPSVKPSLQKWIGENNGSLTNTSTVHPPPLAHISDTDAPTTSESDIIHPTLVPSDVEGLLATALYLVGENDIVNDQIIDALNIAYT